MSKETKMVYIVTAGDYSEYHICDVFDSEELAGLYVSLHGGEIEEWKLNPCSASLRQGQAAWHVRMDRDGNQPSWDRAHPIRGGVLPADRIESVYVDLPDVYVWYLVAHCWAKDSQHATKIVNERRMQILALDRWPTQPAGKRKPTFTDPLGRENPTPPPPTCTPPRTA